MEMNRIQIKCANGNIPSKNIPKRLGFILEGIEREGELLCDGHFTNLEVYSLLCKDFYKV
jgi:ribosomal-protein-serine acetyltransferase